LRPHKIMIFEPYLSNINHLEGNTRHILYLFQFLDRNSFEPFLVSPVSSDFFAHLAPLDGRAYHLPAPASLNVFGGAILRRSLAGRLGMLLALAQYNDKVLNFLRRHRPDIIQCHNLRALLMVGLAARLARIPVIWCVKGLLDNPWLDRLGFVLADRILFQNQANRDNRYPRLIKHYAGKIRILPNGVDLTAVTAAARKLCPTLVQELDLKTENFNIIFLGRVSLAKGVLCLLKAMATVQAAVPSAALYFVGDTSGAEGQECLNHLQSSMHRPGLRNLHVTGWRPDCYEILARMDLLVLPSLSEGVPKVIIEAMALGKPVVATRIGGIPELVQEGKTGLLVAPGDSADLAQAIIALAQDAELRHRMGAQARRVALRKYSIQDNLAGLAKIYQELLRSRSRQAHFASLCRTG
jgi:glycosyltransferase involved in cell wall biosynthesis